MQLAQPVNGTRGMLQTIICSYRNYTKALATLRLTRLLKELRNHNQYFRANSLICSKWLAFALHWQSKEGKEILLPNSQVSASSGTGTRCSLEYIIPLPFPVSLCAFRKGSQEAPEAQQCLACSRHELEQRIRTWSFIFFPQTAPGAVRRVTSTVLHAPQNQQNSSQTLS